jgi:TolA-binding protein
MSQLKGGDKDKANETFARLRREHPASDAARKIPKE